MTLFSVVFHFVGFWASWILPLRRNGVDFILGVTEQPILGMGRPQASVANECMKAGFDRVLSHHCHAPQELDPEC